MKILFTITKSEIGGAQIHVMQLARHMKDSGHAVAVCAYPGGWLENEVTKIGARFYPNKYFANSFNPIRLAKSFFATKKIISDFQPDIVHCHSSFAGIITRLVVRGEIPTIFTAHSFAFTDGASRFRKIIAPISERFVARYTAKIICVSEYDRKLALRYKIAPENKLVKIYNAVAKIEVKEKDLNKKTFDILSVGRFAYPKRFDLLIEAIRNLPENVHLSIVGFGEDKEKLQNLINNYSLSKRVFLIQMSHKDLVSNMSVFDIFVLISKHEGMPMTILEAMSAGLPIIASRVGGIPEEIDESCGILVDNNIEDIGIAIRLLFDTNKQKQMGKASLKRFEDNFTLEKFLTATEQVYEEALGVK
jgi:glycosyltransferase involved in cell wall biosynthesis